MKNIKNACTMLLALTLLVPTIAPSLNTTVEDIKENENIVQPLDFEYPPYF